MRNKKDNLVYIHHINDALEKILAYSTGKSYEDFTSNEWDQDAVMRNLEIIGEAGNNIEKDFREQHKDMTAYQSCHLILLN